MTAEGTQVVFRADASELVGWGHIMRCLTLADELRRRGAVTRFLCASLPVELELRIAASGHVLTGIEAPRLHNDKEWDRAPWPAQVQLQEALCCQRALNVSRPEWMVVDHYRLDAFWERAMRRDVGRIFVIDDLANRPHDCDMLLDGTFGREEFDYRDLVQSGADILAGARLALLRPEFAAARPAALARRRKVPSGRLLISLGSTDVGALTGQVLQAALQATGVGGLDIVFGSGAAPSLSLARALALQDHRLRLHVGAAGQEMARLMAEADLAIGAAGTTSWERCCLGLPTISLILADNQRLIAQMLEEAGAIVTAAATEGPVLTRQIEELLADDRHLARMSMAAAAVTDGGGAARVAERMISRGQSREEMS